MTRKHFEALAAQLKINRPSDVAPPFRESQWWLDVQGVARVCAQFNPHFDRTRFLKACGVEESK